LTHTVDITGISQHIFVHLRYLIIMQGQSIQDSKSISCAANLLQYFEALPSASAS